jgi:hypothetical protein
VAVEIIKEGRNDGGNVIVGFIDQRGQALLSANCCMSGGNLCAGLFLAGASNHRAEDPIAGTTLRCVNLPLTCSGMSNAKMPVEAASLFMVISRRSPVKSTCPPPIRIVPGVCSLNGEIVPRPSCRSMTPMRQDNCAVLTSFRNRERRSVDTELSFQGIASLRGPNFAESVTHVSGTFCHLCLGSLICKNDGEVRPIASRRLGRLAAFGPPSDPSAARTKTGKKPVFAILSLRPNSTACVMGGSTVERQQAIDAGRRLGRVAAFGPPSDPSAARTKTGKSPFSQSSLSDQSPEIQYHGQVIRFGHLRTPVFPPCPLPPAWRRAELSLRHARA